ncbi:hypothetical protein PIB30_082456 [Stylosanthes scabra]|uniref:Uncharacterized protein n=1 Tax=Stylosanthes scabra TaxID=79078 RepID=A0ABU6XSI8_9FABA|nr:hypothetical protein [Stylosanthes scabra]
MNCECAGDDMHYKAFPVFLAGLAIRRFNRFSIGSITRFSIIKVEPSVGSLGFTAGLSKDTRNPNLTPHTRRNGDKEGVRHRRGEDGEEREHKGQWRRRRNAAPPLPRTERGDRRERERRDLREASSATVARRHHAIWRRSRRRLRVFAPPRSSKTDGRDSETWNGSKRGRRRHCCRNLSLRQEPPSGSPTSSSPEAAVTGVSWSHDPRGASPEPPPLPLVCCHLRKFCLMWAYVWVQ